MQLFGLVRYGLQHLENRVLGVTLHILGHLCVGQAGGSEGGDLIFGHGRALDQRGSKTFECGGGNFRADSGGKERCTERGTCVSPRPQTMATAPTRWVTSPSAGVAPFILLDR